MVSELSLPYGHETLESITRMNARMNKSMDDMDADLEEMKAMLIQMNTNLCYLLGIEDPEENPAAAVGFASRRQSEVNQEFEVATQETSKTQPVTMMETEKSVELVLSTKAIAPEFLGSVVPVTGNEKAGIDMKIATDDRIEYLGFNCHRSEDTISGEWVVLSSQQRVSEVANPTLSRNRHEISVKAYHKVRKKYLKPVVDLDSKASSDAAKKFMGVTTVKMKRRYDSSRRAKRGELRLACKRYGMILNSLGFRNCNEFHGLRSGKRVISGICVKRGSQMIVYGAQSLKLLKSLSQGVLTMVEDEGYVLEEERCTKVAQEGNHEDSYGEHDDEGSLKSSQGSNGTKHSFDPGGTGSALGSPAVDASLTAKRFSSKSSKVIYVSFVTSISDGVKRLYIQKLKTFKDAYRLDELVFSCLTNSVELARDTEDHSNWILQQGFHEIALPAVEGRMKLIDNVGDGCFDHLIVEKIYSDATSLSSEMLQCQKWCLLRTEWKPDGLTQRMLGGHASSTELSMNAVDCIWEQGMLVTLTVEEMRKQLRDWMTEILEAVEKFLLGDSTREKSEGILAHAKLYIGNQHKVPPVPFLLTSLLKSRPSSCSEADLRIWLNCYVKFALLGELYVWDPGDIRSSMKLGQSSKTKEKYQDGSDSCQAQWLERVNRDYMMSLLGYWAVQDITWKTHDKLRQVSSPQRLQVTRCIGRWVETKCDSTRSKGLYDRHSTVPQRQQQNLLIVRVGFGKFHSPRPPETSSELVPRLNKVKVSTAMKFTAQPSTSTLRTRLFQGGSIDKI